MDVVVYEQNIRFEIGKILWCEEFNIRYVHMVLFVRPALSKYRLKHVLYALA